VTGASSVLEHRVTVCLIDARQMSHLPDGSGKKYGFCHGRARRGVVFARVGMSALERDDTGRSGVAATRKPIIALRAAVACLVAGAVVLGAPMAPALPVDQQPAAAADIAVAAGFAGASPGGSPNDHAADEILVRFDPAVPRAVRQTVHAMRGNSAVRSFSLVPGLELVKLAPGAVVSEAVRAYSGMSGVRYAEPNQTYHLAATPNDEFFSLLWGLDNTGQTYSSNPPTTLSGTADADIDAPEAWEVTTGSADVLVALIDTGVDYTHPDLVDNIWINPGEIAGNGIDDDDNGYIDDVHGWNAVANNGDPMDDNGHGTHCAGTIGASGNNDLGVTGVNWDVSIVAIKAGNASGSFSLSDMIEAMQYAHAIGADLTSNSYGGWGTFSQSLYDAIEATDSLFVAAAGNDGMDISGSFPGGVLEGKYYPPNSSWSLMPASYDLDNIIAVGASDADDLKASLSNYSSTKVDLFAPGMTIGSTYPGGQYMYMSGTSMATPHVAGVAALILSARPTLDWAELKATITRTVDPKAALSAYCVTGGRLNARGVTAPRLEADDDSYTAAEDAMLSVPAASGVLVGDFDLDGDTLTTSRDGASGPSHGELSLESDGSFTYTPDADYHGSDRFTYRASDGALYSNFATVWITVTPVNDPPSFTGGSDVSVAESSGGYSAAWATAISPGPLETESVTFKVVNDNTALFAVQPAIGSAGTLTFTPAAAVHGSAVVSVTLRDAYGLSSGTEAFTITVTPNTPPVPLVPVHRFYNVINNTHFFTDSAEEMYYVIANWPTIYRYEGVAYNTNPANNTQSLYRFYNKVSRSHFYTASEVEKDYVIATWPTVFDLDGLTYKVSLAPVPNSLLVYRFYNLRNGSHFYTASEVEKDYVIATWPTIYQFEGPAFWVGQ